MRESLAATHHSSLEWNPDTERAIDKVAASGLCDALGILLWKAKYMLESPAYREAEKQLRVRVKDQFKREAWLICDKVTEQGLREYLSDRCKTCGGRGGLEVEVQLSKLVITCDVCSGSGTRRFTDFERARAMSLSLGRVKTLQRHFNWLSSQIWTLDDLVGRQIKFYVGRYD